MSRRLSWRRRWGLGRLVLRLILVTGLALWGDLLAGPGAVALAAPDHGVEAAVAGEASVTVAHQAHGAVSETVGVFAGRLALQLNPAVAAPWWVALTVEPWFPVDLSGTGVVAGSVALVTEAYAGLRFPAVDVYVGRFQLPLETARLTMPFTLTPHDQAGRRPGVDGARTDVYLPTGRLQLGVVRAGEEWTRLLGWRQQLVGWEATGYVLWREDGLAAGVGASGLIGSTVVYGELWSLKGAPGLRGSVGATGYVGDFLWTAEVGRASVTAAGGAGDETTEASVAAAQLAYAFPSGWAVIADALVFLDKGAPAGGGGLAGNERAYEVGVALSYGLLPGQAEVELSLRRQVRPPQPAGLGLAGGLRWFF
ncbi:MAG: hypothetical protein BAA04_12690 [Firmicutes bacterium ZCTH02-B6]|nr:MAG: hypothetical protein BAA04_12690 [Firmicutes bacterium ZCTH02-B6]